MTHTFLPIRLSMLLLGFFLIACEEDTQQVILPSTAQFESSELSLSENADNTTVRILLSTSAKKSGELTIRLTASDANLVTTEPAATGGVLKLPVAVGQSAVSFDVLPVDNHLLDGNRTIGFTITSATEGFIVGPTKQLAATLIDDEMPAQASFLLNLGTIRENASEGSIVIVNLSHLATGTGAVHVSFQSDKAIYGTHFITQPAAVNGRISIPVAVGINHLEFKVLPVNDELFNEDRIIAYSIAEVEGAVVKGANLLHELKITNDDMRGTGKGYEIFAGN